MLLAFIMAQSEVPATLPGARQNATPEPIGEAAVVLSDRTAEDWMPAVGSPRKSAEPFALAWPWRSPVVRRRRGPDWAPLTIAEASAESGPPAVPEAAAPAPFAAAVASSLASAPARGSGSLASLAVADWRRGPGQVARLQPGTGRGIDWSKIASFERFVY